MNYMLSLSIEVIVKLKKQTHTYFKIRRVGYHAFSIGLALFLVVLAASLGDYGSSNMQTCSVVPRTVTANIRLATFAIEIVAMWAMIAYMMKKVGKTYSNVIFNYFLVIFTMSASVTIVNILGFAKDFQADHPHIYTELALVIGSTTGISIGLSRLSNRRLIRHILWKFGIKLKPKKNIYTRTITLTELSDSILNENIFNLGDLFENLSKKTLMQILSVIFLRFSEHHRNSYSLENEPEYDQYEFDQELFETLGKIHDLPRIIDRKSYVVYDPDLYLLEYKPDVFGKIRYKCRIDNDDLLR